MRKAFYGILLLLYQLFHFINNLILKLINLLVGAKSSRYFCILHIVYVFTMVLICEITKIRICTSYSTVQVQYGKYFMSLTYFATYFASL